MHKQHHPSRAGRLRKAIEVLVVLVALLSAASVFRGQFQRSQTVYAINEETERMLSEVLLPELNLQEATLDEAIAHLNRALPQQCEPGTLRFERWTQPELPRGILINEDLHILVSASGLEPLARSELSSSPTARSEARISIVIASIPLNEAVRYVAGLSDSVAGQRGGVIYFVEVPKGRPTLGPLLKRTFQINPAFHSSGKPGVVDLKPFFRSQGIEFYVGSEASLHPGGELVVRNTREEIGLIEGLLGPPERDSTWIAGLKSWYVETVDKLSQQLSRP